MLYPPAPPTAPRSLCYLPSTSIHWKDARIPTGWLRGKEVETVLALHSHSSLASPHHHRLLATPQALPDLALQVAAEGAPCQHLRVTVVHHPATSAHALLSNAL